MGSSICQSQATHRVEPVEVDENNRDGCLNTAAATCTHPSLEQFPPAELIHSVLLLVLLLVPLLLQFQVSGEIQTKTQAATPALHVDRCVAAVIFA